MDKVLFFSLGGGDITYQPWAVGEPNNLYDDDRCISLSAFSGHPYAWNDEKCSIDWIEDLGVPVYFICQFGRSNML